MTSIKHIYHKIKNNFIIFFALRVFAVPIILLLTAELCAVISYYFPQQSDMVIFCIFIALSCVELLLLIFYFIKETFRLHKTLQIAYRNINLIVLGIYLVASLTIYFLFFADEFMYSQESPDGKYKLEIYTQRSLMAMPGTGGLYGRPVKAILKNSWGWKIGESNDECLVLYDDVDIMWDIKNHEVFFGRAHAIDLNTGECVN